MVMTQLASASSDAGTRSFDIATVMTNHADANPFAYHETEEDRTAAAADKMPKFGWPEWVAAALLGVASMAQALAGLVALVVVPWAGIILLIGTAVPWASAKFISDGKWPWSFGLYFGCFCTALCLMGAPATPPITTTVIVTGYSYWLHRRRIQRLDYWL